MSKQKTSTDEIPINLIADNDYNPRKHFDSARMAELTKSIANQGIVQAITVRPIKDGKYEVVAGVRRLKATKNAGLKTIPALVKELDDKGARLLSLTENLERADLTPIEEAIAFADYLGWDEQRAFDGKLQEKGERAQLVLLADSLPITKETIRIRLRLLHLPPRAQTMIEQGSLPIREATIIASLYKLWKSRTNGLTEDQIEQQRGSIKAGIHEKMASVVELGLGEEKLRSYVKNILEAEAQDQKQRAVILTESKEKLDEVSKTLTVSVGEVLKEYPEVKTADWKDLSEAKQAEALIAHLGNLLGAETRIEEIGSERAWAQVQRDKILVNMEYVKQHALEECPYCGAGIELKAMGRIKERLEEQVQSLNKEEETIGEEQRACRDSKDRLREVLDEFEATKRSYEEQVNLAASSPEGSR